MWKPRKSNFMQMSGCNYGYFRWFEDSQLHLDESAAGSANTPPPWYDKEGPMPTISDSLFSLIILIYVSVIFVFMFFSFCWKEPEPPPPDPAHKNIPMITSILEEMEKQEAENKKAAEAAQLASESSSSHNEMTEMVEMKNIENSKADGNGSVVKKDSDTIIVNVITEKSKSVSVNDSKVKEEQV